MLLQNGCKYLIHDRDSKFCKHFDGLLRSVHIEPVRLPPRSPNLNAYAERFILSLRARKIMPQNLSLPRRKGDSPDHVVFRHAAARMNILIPGDQRIIRRYHKSKLDVWLAVDPDYA